jgi:hypothetical protein
MAISRGFPLCLCAALALLAGAARGEAPALSCSFNGDGSYILATPLFNLTSAPLIVLVNGSWLSSENGGLAPGAVSVGSGADAWGPFTSTSLTWAQGGPSGPALLTTSIQVYLSSPAVLFAAAFHGGFSTGANLSGSTGVLASFPAWALPAAPGDGSLGWFQWAGTMLNQKNDEGPLAGAWDASANFSEGLGAGPVVLFPPSAASSLVLSAASEFMAVSSCSTTAGSACGGGGGGGAPLRLLLAPRAAPQPSPRGTPTPPWRGGAQASMGM